MKVYYKLTQNKWLAYGLSLLLTLACLMSAKAQPGSHDPSFTIGTALNGAVHVISTQPDGKLLIGGQFTTFNSTSRNQIARLNADGTLDTSFNPGTGFDNIVFAIVVQSNGKILVGGRFTTFNGNTHNRIVRLNEDGTLDTSFTPGSGFDNDVRSLSVQSDGKIVVSGKFITFNGNTHNRIVRLNTNGTLDSSLSPPGSGFNNEISKVYVQSDGKILAVGGFNLFNGSALNCIARLNADGSLDTSFNPSGSGFNATVVALHVQSDGKMMVGGGFTSFNGTSCKYIVRLNTNGTLDTSFNPPGSGLDGDVFVVSTQPDGKILAGGAFTSFNGTSRNYMLRLNADGSLDTGFDSGSGFGAWVRTIFIQADGKILAGGDFSNFNGIARYFMLRLNGVASAPEINLQSNNISIADGSTAYSTTNNTDFWKVNINTASARTFTIQNTGTAVLNISSITSSNAKFVVSGAPFTISAGSSATRLLTYTPDAVMVDNTTLTINSDDANEAVYDVAIRGEGLPTYAWSNVGTAGFSTGQARYQSLKFHPTSGEPYVAYRDGTSGGKTTVMRFTANTWTAVGDVGFSAGSAFYQSLAFHPTSGEPYVAYRDEANSSKATVMRYDGTNWTVVGIAGLSAGLAESTSLAFHPTSGEPYIAYQDWGNGFKTTVMRFNGTDWVNVGAVGFSAGQAAFQSLAFHPTSGEPYVAYSDGASNKATVMRFNGTDWVNVGTAEFSAGQANSPSLAFHPTLHEPYVAYSDNVNGTKTTVMRFNGTNWVNVGIAGFSTSSGAQSLAFHPFSNEPYVSYRDWENSQKTTLMRYNGIAWVIVGTAGFSTGSVEVQSLAFHPTTGEAYVAYGDGANSNKTTAMRFTLPPAEINLTGNNTNIADGSTSPTTTDHTLFTLTAVNGSSTRTYTIHNTDTGALSITNVAISGTDASLFTVSGLPAFPFNINGNSSQTFTVTFAPTSTGTKDATITITNSDTDEASYDFAIRGVGAILNVFVAPAGSDANDGLSIILPKLTITNAIATVEEGGTVNIGTGTYPQTATINKNVTFATTGTVIVQNLTTNTAGKTLTLNSPLQVSRVVSLQNGTIASNGNLVIASNATESGLIDNFTAGYVGTITGNIQVQRYVPSSIAGIRFVGAPVSNAVASQFNGFQVRAYNESAIVSSLTQGWQNIVGTTTLNAFDGYSVIQPTAGNQTYTLTGVMNSGVYNRTITRGATTSSGYNALCNPYPSPIRWTTLNTLNASAGITGTVQIYKTTGLSTGGYGTVNAGGVVTNGATNMISSMQAFLVRKTVAGSSNFTINNTVRNNIYTNNNNFLRNEEKTLVRLQMTNGTYADEAVLYAEKEATGKIDAGLDAEKLAGDADKPYLSFVHHQQDWAITALPTLPTGLAMPIAIRGNGTYTLLVTEKTVLNENLYLYDRKVGKLHDLYEGYTFQAVGAENNRFVLYVGKPATEQLAQAGEVVRVWSYDKTIHLHFADADLAYQAQVQVLNVQGQKVLGRQAFQDANTQLQTTLPTGAYIVRVQTLQGVVTQKIVIE